MTVIPPEHAEIMESAGSIKDKLQYFEKQFFTRKDSSTLS